MLLENTPPEVAWKTTGKLLIILCVLIIISIVLPAGYDFTTGFYMPWTPYFLSYPDTATKSLPQVQLIGALFYAISLIPKAIVILFILIAVSDIIKQGRAKMDPTTIILSKKVVLSAIFCLAMSLYVAIPYVPEVVARIGREFLYSGTLSPEFLITEAMIFITELDMLVIFIISVYLLLLIQKVHVTVYQAIG